MSAVLHVDPLPLLRMSPFGLTGRWRVAIRFQSWFTSFGFCTLCRHALVRRTRTLSVLDLRRNPAVLTEPCILKTSPSLTGLGELGLNPRTTGIGVILVGGAPLAPAILARSPTLGAPVCEAKVHIVLPLQENPLYFPALSKRLWSS